LANRNARDHGSARVAAGAAGLYGSLKEGGALITITALAVPDAKIEIQGYAVLAASETSKVIE
jgi:hypothetical protein